MRFDPLTSLDLVELCDLFNAAFTGYAIPVHSTPRLMAGRIREESIDLHHSFMAWEDRTRVGLVLLGIRGTAAWIAGLGVVPSARGRGVAHALTAAAIGRARAAGLERLSLEVLVGNTGAFKAYARAGLTVTRDLLVLERPDGPGPGRGAPLTTAPTDRLLQHFWRLHQEPMPWQRDLPSLLVKHGTTGLCLGHLDDPTGYALLMSPRKGVTYLLELAAAPEHARSLVRGIGALSGRLLLALEPARSALVPYLRQEGFLELDRLHEMAMDL